MLEEQNGVCAICGQKEIELNSRNKRIQKLSIDHDHKTGKIRELLCLKCNYLIGAAKENIVILETAIKYLLKHKD